MTFDDEPCPREETGMTYDATAGGCDARWRANKPYHLAGDKCGAKARLVLTMGGATMLLCAYHAKRIEKELLRKNIVYSLRALPRPGIEEQYEHQDSARP